MIKAEVFLCRNIRHHGARRKIPGPCCCRRHRIHTSDTLGLAYALVVAKDENPVPPNRPSRGSPELIPLERWDDVAVKEVSGVERAIAQKLVDTSMKLVRPRARGGAHDAARSPAVLSRIVACQDREFLNGVHAQITPQYASRTAVSVIVYTDAVHAIIILLRA